jgi:hypothetical protein
MRRIYYRNILSGPCIVLFLLISLFFALHFDIHSQEHIEINIKFIRPPRVNDINFVEITAAANSHLKGAMLRLEHPNLERARFKIDLDSPTFKSTHNRELNRIKYMGHFFLPNVIPVGPIRVSLMSREEKIYEKDFILEEEVIYHTPLHTKGWQKMALEVQTGMKNIKAESYPNAAVSFANPKKRCYFFLRVALSPDAASKYKQLKLKIFIEGRILDELIVTKNPRDYVYCLTSDSIGKKDWLKFRFKATTSDGREIAKKENVLSFDHLALVPFNGLPDWIDQFLTEPKPLTPNLRRD